MGKKLTTTKKKKAGRSRGKISVRHRGGGHKRKYRHIDFKREKIGVPARIKSIEYDPNRSARVALCVYQDGEKRYIIAPQDLKEQDTIITNNKTPLKPGNRMKLKNIPSGIQVYNIELTPQKGAQLVRAAGNTAQVMGQEGKYTQIKLPSGEIRLILGECFATIGEVSYPEHATKKLYKAGQARWKGKRPQVRGVAMAPVDHPHGGGEGRTGVGRKHSKTPWGKPAHGKKTRKKKPSDKLIIKRRK